MWLPPTRSWIRRCEHEALSALATTIRAIGFLWPRFATHIGFFLAVPWENRSASYFRTVMQLLNSNAHTVDARRTALERASRCRPQLRTRSLRRQPDADAAVDNE